jgi:hypothetical protein
VFIAAENGHHGWEDCGLLHFLSGEFPERIGFVLQQLPALISDRSTCYRRRPDMMTRRVQLKAPVPVALRLWQQTQAGPKLAITAGEVTQAKLGEPSD